MPTEREGVSNDSLAVRLARIERMITELLKRQIDLADGQRALAARFAGVENSAESAARIASEVLEELADKEED